MVEAERRGPNRPEVRGPLEGGHQPSLEVEAGSLPNGRCSAAEMTCPPGTTCPQGTQETKWLLSTYCIQALFRH